MSYNQRGGIRMNRNSYGGGGGGGSGGSYGGGGHQQNYHSSQNQSYTQPAYSTPSSYVPSKPLLNDPRSYQPTHLPSQKPPVQQPMQQQPMQQQQQPQPLQAQAQQQQQPSSQQQVVQPLPVPPPPPKIEPQSPMPTTEQNIPVKMDEDKDVENSMEISEDGTGGAAGGVGAKGPKFRPWNKRGAANVKITRKMRKRRQNARLRNLLAPKNAMMVLHELHPELKMVISEQVNAANQTAYTVEIEVEGKIFRGHGMSKMSAKQSASENALKAVLLEKLEQNNLKINPDNTLGSDGTTDPDLAMKEESVAPAGDATATATTPTPTPTTAGSGEANPDEQAAAPPKLTQGRRPIEDDVPWGSLASFALFKLFSEWQSQGFQLPPSGLPPVFHKTTGVKKIPDDANKKHPVQLLNQIRPGSQYSESREGIPPNLTFKFTVNVDGQTFVGVGSNKKDAKKECAKQALEALGVKYD